MINDKCLTPAFGALALTLGFASPVAAEVLFQEPFDSDVAPFAGFSSDGTWGSHYQQDGWRTDLNGGVIAASDAGCTCGMGGQGSCEFTVYVGGGESDAFDNHITHVPAEPWTDVVLSVRLRNDDDDGLGVLFRYANTANFYAVLMSRQLVPGPGGCDAELVGTRVVKVSGGVQTVLAEVPEAYTIGVEHQLEVLMVGLEFLVSLDGVPLIIATDDDPASAHVAGGIGLLAYQNGADEAPCDAGGCWFDDVVVSDEIDGPADSDDDGVPDAQDNCPGLANAGQQDTDEDGLGDPCDGDDDGDGRPDSQDSCPLTPDDGLDSDGDGLGDACDPTPRGDGDAGAGPPDAAGSPDASPGADAGPGPTDELAPGQDAAGAGGDGGGASPELRPDVGNTYTVTFGEDEEGCRAGGAPGAPWGAALVTLLWLARRRRRASLHG